MQTLKISLSSQRKTKPMKLTVQTGPNHTTVVPITPEQERKLFEQLSKRQPVKYGSGIF